MLDGRRLGDLLQEQNIVTADRIEAALAEQQASGGNLGEILVAGDICTWKQITEAIATESGLPIVDVAEARIPPNVIEYIPRETADEHLILPVERHDGTLRVAVVDPYDLETIDELRFRLNIDIEPCLTDPESLRNAIVQNYGAGEEDIEMQMEQFTEQEIDFKGGELDLEAPEERADAPVIRLVHTIIVEAIKARASDIHIEPFEKRVRIRFRIDGIAHEIDKIPIPKRLQGPVLSRIKIMAKMQIEEHRKPQDGQIKMNVMGRQIDLRVSVLPATWGESIVMRILEKEVTMLGVQDLGFMDDDYEIFQGVIKRPNGIFLVTGPTGSGKTTTLSSALNELNRPDTKIITAEDPVEYHISGVNQSQVNHQIGLTFARILRAMLRQAPNIILVGEIRDKETADMAIEAALTGHLVFSTLHTNDAPSAITRLIDMGVKPFLVASSLQGIMAQRLVRVICANCKEEYTPDEKEILSLGMRPAEFAGRILYRGRGCPECNNTGYKGRKGIFEILVLNRTIREMTFARKPLVEIRKAAVDSGMRGLRQDGIRKVLSGMTSLEEVNRATHEGGGP